MEDTPRPLGGVHVAGPLASPFPRNTPTLLNATLFHHTPPSFALPGPSPPLRRPPLREPVRWPSRRFLKHSAGSSCHAVAGGERGARKQGGGGGRGMGKQKAGRGDHFQHKDEPRSKGRGFKRCAHPLHPASLAFVLLGILELSAD